MAKSVKFIDRTVGRFYGFPVKRRQEQKANQQFNVWHGFCAYYFRAIPRPSACERGAHSYVEAFVFCASVVGAFSVAVSLATLAVPASAQVDPSNIHVGPGAGVACDTGCAGAPNLVGSGSTLDLYQTSGGKSLVDPTLLILAVPNDPAGTGHGMQQTAGSVTALNYFGSYTPFPGATGPSTPVTFAFGSTADGVMKSSTGFAGDLTSGNDVYGFLGIGASVTNSDSFTNFTDPTFNIPAVDKTATNFGIYVFQLNTGLGAQELININDASLPIGTYILGFGLDSMGQPDSTPHTEAGDTSTTVVLQDVPEPSALALSGTALAALGFIRWRRKPT